MNKLLKVIALILFGCAALLSCIWIYFQKNLEKIEPQEYGTQKIYGRHYLLIADDEKSLLWESIYRSASQHAEENNAYLELLVADEKENYRLEDCLKIGIASQVDGIILRPDGRDEVRQLMDQAMERKIPVVTVLEEDSNTSRISFVGLNSYQMGDAYTERALQYLRKDHTEILILLDSSTREIGNNLIYSKITSSLEKNKKPDQSIHVVAHTINSSSDFETEEVIRDIFVNNETLPDILICLDEVATECSYQALLDYNKVGSVDIIGFYYSSLILDGIAKGNIPATIALDTEEIGRYCIDALQEYHKQGYASDYYSVGLRVVDRKNSQEFQNSLYQNLTEEEA